MVVYGWENDLKFLGKLNDLTVLLHCNDDGQEGDVP